MKILCLTTFLHGRDRFEQGDIRTVSDEDGQYFVSNGWARESGADAVAAFDGVATLNVHSTLHAQEARNG